MLIALCLGGFTKGVISWGFPLVSLPILTIALPPTSAIFLLFFPIIFANIREIKIKNWKTYKKLIPFSLGIFCGIIIGSVIFHTSNSDIISIAIGITIIICGVINFVGFKINEKYLLKPFFGLSYGLVSGIIGGMTTVLGPFMIIYLVSLNLSKNIFSEFVSLAVFSTLIPLYGMFFIYQDVVISDFFASGLALIPALLMQFLGLKIRNIIPQEKFRKMTLTLLITVGFLVIFKNF
jgi:uncharacterized membrane protein YfcA|tara:strand:- start:94 stop:801 length:708 start_codon:yes stop_codon:yes gene_type:complete